MKLLTETGFSRLLTEIKNFFVSRSEGIEAGLVDIDLTASAESANLITSNAVYTAVHDMISGTHDGTNWTNLTIDGTTKAIPAGGGTSSGNVDDVRVNGTSVVTDKIANIDLTTKLDKATSTSTESEYFYTFKGSDQDTSKELVTNIFSDSTDSMIPTAKAVATSLAQKSVVSGQNDGTNWTSITIDGTKKNIVSGVTSFDALSDRPNYNGSIINSSTEIPLVKTETWDSKQDELTSAQLAAVDSGITASKVAAYDAYSTSKQNALPTTTTAGMVLKSTSIGGTVTWGEAGGVGTVTKIIAGDGLAGGTITTEGTISLADSYGDTKNPYASKTKNYVLAAPSSANGEPTFRSLVAADIPSLDTSKITSGTLADDRIASATTWNAKYTKAALGIPKTDLASDVQTSLGKADTALQSHQDISGKENSSNKVTTVSSESTDTQYPSAKCVYKALDAKQDIATLETAVADVGFTKNKGTITGIEMNGASKGVSGVVDLGTVLTSHQDISGKEDTTNKVTTISSSSTDDEYPSAKLLYNSIQQKADKASVVTYATSLTAWNQEIIDGSITPNISLPSPVTDKVQEITYVFTAASTNASFTAPSEYILCDENGTSGLSTGNTLSYTSLTMGSIYECSFKIISSSIIRLIMLETPTA